ncbi:MAG: ATP-binding protein [Bacteroides sp.]|nr:ATP-binding protein [Bacteroides sp.]MCM1084740.1 ATP-binding protein [Bacteroides sp.]
MKRSGYIERSISPAILESLEYYPVITITGPRQSGKSTLARHLFADYFYCSMENPDERSRAQRDPRNFLNRETGMIIDEVQRTPELLSYIQGIVDENPDRRFVLTGSAQFALLKSVSQSLAGRAAVFELLPFSFPEARTEMSQSGIDDILWKGAYPAIWSGAKPASSFYRNYTMTYLERDVRQIASVKDLDKFHAFLRLCASRAGSLFVASELSNELGISHNTVQTWLGILQASYIVFMLPPFFGNIRKRLTRTPKLYFTDTGLLCYLLGIENASHISFDKMRGHIFENFVITEALKQRFKRAKQSNLSFYRDSHGNEVDLLLQKGNAFRALEIKSSSTYHPQFSKGLDHIEKVLGDRIEQKAVIYTGASDKTNFQEQLLNYSDLYDFVQF